MTVNSHQQKFKKKFFSFTKKKGHWISLYSKEINPENFRENFNNTVEESLIYGNCQKHLSVSTGDCKGNVVFTFGFI